MNIMKKNLINNYFKKRFSEKKYKNILVEINSYKIPVSLSCYITNIFENDYFLETISLCKH
jgi:hypothetical protein